MNITLLGTGTPLPHPERAGTGVLIEVNDEPLLFDCGPKSLDRIIDKKVSISDIEYLFFTHHHIDHNSSFFNFLLMGWMLGRDKLTVGGPEVTLSLLDAFYEIYDEDIKYKERVTDQSINHLKNTTFELVSEDFSYDTDDFKLTATEVNHPIETYAYRIEDPQSDTVVVLSPDTGYYPPLAEFATDADVLIHDSMVAPPLDPIPESKVLAEYRGRYPLDESDWDTFKQTHSSAGEAGKIANQAGVDTLVLTHIMQLRDTKQMKAEAEAEFDGKVIVGSDEMNLSFSHS
ncbi:MBL fold metallo-hydrolase [Halobellus captivus]|uniref:MBL fold metallo-hydrolase n=1 Tax=Halobellus captivus TaxID=2592614 RepID=UPI0011A0747D|nr:MBL fold metallo-hydrolase [Halobellus captivus]